MVSSIIAAARSTTATAALAPPSSKTEILPELATVGLPSKRMRNVASRQTPVAPCAGKSGPRIGMAVVPPAPSEPAAIPALPEAPPAPEPEPEPPPEPEPEPELGPEPELPPDPDP